MTPVQPVVVDPRIEKLLTEGESQTVEFKTRLPDIKLLARLLVAFANSDGGTLVVGVDDSGSPVGLSNEDAVRTHARLRDLVSSMLPWETPVGIVDIGGRPVVYVEVLKAPPNLAPIATAEGEFFVRKGRTYQKVDGEELIRAARNSTSSVAGRPLNSTTRAKTSRRKAGALQLFVAMSFAFEEEPSLVDYFEAIRRAVRRAPRKLEIKRVDLIPGDYEISQAVMDMIADADIVLADFTRSPQNVYFEAGFARGCGKPVLQTARAGTLLHFDVKTWRTTFFKNATELEEKLVGELAALIGRARAVSNRKKKSRRGSRTK